MDPLKAAAATAVCLALFWLAFRLTRQLVDLVIAGGYAEERLRLAEEAVQEAALGATAAHAASTRDEPSAGAQSTATAAIDRVQSAPAKRPDSQIGAVQRQARDAQRSSPPPRKGDERALHCPGHDA